MKKKNRLHIRRCHLCSVVTEREGEVVDRCGNCGKAMAPFYFFNELEVSPLSDFDLRMPLCLKAGERIPVRGFTAFW